MTNSPNQIADAYFQSWKERDLPGLRSIMAESVTFDGPLASLKGAEEVSTALGRLAQLTENITIQKRFIDGIDVLTWFGLHTTVAPPTPVANWSKIVDGKITEIRVTFDPREIVAATPNPPRHD